MMDDEGGRIRSAKRKFPVVISILVDRQIFIPPVIGQSLGNESF